MSVLIPSSPQMAREPYMCVQGDLSEGTLTPVELPEQEASDNLVRSSAVASSSDTALWGEDLQVCLQAVPVISHVLCGRCPCERRKAPSKT